MIVTSSLRRLRSPLIMLALAVLSSTLGGCSCPLTRIECAAEGFRSYELSLAAVDGSGVSGSGYFTPSGDGFIGNIQLLGTVAGQTYYGHVHLGTSCASLAGIVRSVPSVDGVAVDGPAATGLFTLAKSDVDHGYFMDYHTTVSGVEQPVACGAMP